MATIINVIPHDDYTLEIRLDNSHKIVYAMGPRLQAVRFCSLADRNKFKAVSIEGGNTLVWDSLCQITLDEMLSDIQRRRRVIELLPIKNNLKTQNKEEGIMNKTVKKLFEEMNKDQKFAEKLLSLRETEEVIALAGEKGIALTGEDIEEANRLISATLDRQKGDGPGGELSEEDLEAVAGGFGFMPINIIRETASALSLPDPYPFISQPISAGN